jgi:hypothetical protein
MSITSIIVETGSNVSGANSYLSVADVIQYAKDRQYTFQTSVSVLIIKAMDYIETLSYKGSKLTRNQGLQWPRYNVIIDGYYVDPLIIPNDLKKGLAECIMAIDQGNDPMQNIPVQVLRQKVDSLEIEYQPGSPQYEINRKIKNVMWKLLAGGGNSGNVVNVGRG